MTPVLAQINIRTNFFLAHPNAAKIGNTPGGLITSLLPNIMVIAGVIFLFIIIISGLNMVTNAGHGASPQIIAKHKATFIQSLIGFLIVISAYFILQIVSTTTGVNFMNPGI